MKTKLEPQFNEGMPREVAISILTEPKAKISNAFRKTCKRALETHFIAPPPRQPADPLRALHGRTWKQLHKWLKRCKARRTVAQREYEKLIALENPTARDKRRVAVLGLMVTSLDKMRDDVEDEVALRNKIMTAVIENELKDFGVTYVSATERRQIRLDTQRPL